MRVWFAHVARFAKIRLTDETQRYVRRLSRDHEGTFMATTRADYEALRPYEYEVK